MESGSKVGKMVSQSIQLTKMPQCQDSEPQRVCEGVDVMEDPATLRIAASTRIQRLDRAQRIHDGDQHRRRRRAARRRACSKHSSLEVAAEGPKLTREAVTGLVVGGPLLGVEVGVGFVESTRVLADPVRARHVCHHHVHQLRVGSQHRAVEDGVLATCISPIRPATQLGEEPVQVAQEPRPAVGAERRPVGQVRPRRRDMDLAQLSDLGVMLELAAHVMPQRAGNVAPVAEGRHVLLQTQAEASCFGGHDADRHGHRVQGGPQVVDLLAILILVLRDGEALGLGLTLESCAITRAAVFRRVEDDQIIHHGGTEEPFCGMRCRPNRLRITRSPPEMIRSQRGHVPMYRRATSSR